MWATHPPARQYADVVLTGDGEIDEEMDLVLTHIKRRAFVLLCPSNERAMDW
jgi:hypothetical protein